MVASLLRPPAPAAFLVFSGFPLFSAISTVGGSQSLVLGPPLLIVLLQGGVIWSQLHPEDWLLLPAFTSLQTHSQAPIFSIVPRGHCPATEISSTPFASWSPSPLCLFLPLLVTSTDVGNKGQKEMADKVLITCSPLTVEAGRVTRFSRNSLLSSC